MKSYKLLLLSSALAMSVSAYGSTAWATGDLNVDVNKVKEVDVDLDIDKDKRVDIIVDADFDLIDDGTTVTDNTLDGAAEIDSVVNQENKDNTIAKADGANDDTAFLNTADLTGDGIRLRVDLDNVANNNTGIVQINNDVGYMANQGNVVAIAVVNRVGPPDDTGRDFAQAEESAEQRNENNEITTQGGLGIDRDGPDDTDLGQDARIVDPDRNARINNSINENSGIVQVNQNAGAMNNQLNDIGLAVADVGAVVALAEADLGQFNINNTVDSTNTVKRNEIKDSIFKNTGIVNVNQTTGNMNNQGTVISFAGLATIN